MEDVNMGYLAHWEARIMGPDVMSYGIGSGEAYISDITLAYFADSGHYLVSQCNSCPIFFSLRHARYSYKVDSVANICDRSYCAVPGQLHVRGGRAWDVWRRANAKSHRQRRGSN